jgi:deoxyribonuclease V
VIETVAPQEDEASHSWEVTPAEARAIQDRLRHLVIPTDQFQEIRSVAGIDVGFEEGGRITRAAVAVLRFPSLEPVEDRIARRPTSFPYVPGLLSFREIPAVLDALAKADQNPDLLLCDGQGYAHPRRFGLACHLGVATGLPTIGAAKSRLSGEHAELGMEKGSQALLLDGDEVIGVALRTRAGVRPMYVSIGHRICLETAVAYVLACTRRYRLPETTRRAHWLASIAKDRAAD